MRSLSLKNKIKTHFIDRCKLTDSCSYFLQAKHFISLSQLVVQFLNNAYCQQVKNSVNFNCSFIKKNSVLSQSGSPKFLGIKRLAKLLKLLDNSAFISKNQILISSMKGINSKLLTVT